MLNKNITPEEYAKVMAGVWGIVRGYCEDDQEAANCLTNAVENYFYDQSNGASEWQSIDNALHELYVDMDFAEEFFNGISALGVKAEEDEEESVYDEYVQEPHDCQKFVMKY